jgi:CTP synthase (UTP-ammonia lyase)
MRLAIIGDYDDSFEPHRATHEAIAHSSKKFDIRIGYDWVATDTIEARWKAITAEYDAYWIAPGSPYKSMAGALKIIQYARENGVPVLGTCGGFQHMVIEFARNVLGIEDAQHAEYNPYSSKLVVNPLSCSLAGQVLEIEITDKSSRVFSILRSDKISESYYCNFGLNPDYEDQLNDAGFRIVGTDSLKEARILELKDHPFFIATLFVPQANSTPDSPHKLVTAFLKSIV